MAKKVKHTHVLAIRLSAMGDVAMLVPVCSALGIAHPDLRITLLTKERFAPIFEGLSNVQVVPAKVTAEHKGVFGLYKLFKSLKKLQIDAVADTHNVVRSTILKLFFRLSGIPVVQLDKGRQEKKALTREKNKVFKPLRTTHERYADVFRTLGYPVGLTKSSPLKTHVLTQDVRQLLGVPGKKRIGVAPFAAHEGKMYPLDLMEKVIWQLSKQKDCTILLFGGGQKEINILNGISKSIGQNVVAIAGKIEFKEELSLLSNLDVMLSMDSGNGHLAANYGVPVISLWGVTHPYAGFAPFGQTESLRLLSDRRQYPLIPTSIFGNTVPAGYEKAMRTIAPETVVEKVVAVLKGAYKH